jgi:hypothetical protein
MFAITYVLNLIAHGQQQYKYDTSMILTTANGMVQGHCVQAPGELMMKNNLILNDKGKLRISRNEKERTRKREWDGGKEGRDEENRPKRI